MKTLWYCLCIFILFFSSCQKEDDPVTPVLAGVVDEAMNYKELNPALQIAFIHDPNLNIEYGKDSLDIDRDGSYDIIISQRNLLGIPPAGAKRNDTYPFCSLTIKNGVEVATKEETYPVGHGYSNSVYWVDTIVYRANVVAILNWTESNRDVKLWAECQGFLSPSDGPWYNLVNEERYVAFRMKINSRYRYGWIKVMVTSRERIAVVSYALQK